MSLRILHTADNHIGLSFNRYSETAKDRLIEERFASLDRMVTTANERKAHFIVVAGDLFDKATVTKTQGGKDSCQIRRRVSPRARWQSRFL